MGSPPLISPSDRLISSLIQQSSTSDSSASSSVAPSAWHRSHSGIFVGTSNHEDLLTVMEFLQLCSSCASLPPFLSDAALSLEDPSSKDSLCLSSQWPAPAWRDSLRDESDVTSSPAAQSFRFLTHGPFHQRLWQQLCGIYLQQRSWSTKPVFHHHCL